MRRRRPEGTGSGSKDGARFDLAHTPPGLDRPLADELLEPCAIYAPEVVSLARDGLLHAAAHVTPEEGDVRGGQAAA